ncbi:MAG: cation:proton antiporter, partial [Candidatus Thermoplasmatota archaeon]|nr:cation:proton antiporter [Candidatus Thermoplasmatota archaeon]
MIETIFFTVGVLLVLYIVGCAIRLASGPTGPDRAVALDTINTLVVASMLALGVAYKEVLFIDIAIVYALLSFITTLYIARFLQESANKQV